MLQDIGRIRVLFEKTLIICCRMKKAEVFCKMTSVAKNAQQTDSTQCDVIYFRHHQRVWEPKQATIKLVMKHDNTGKYLGSNLQFSDYGFAE